MSFSPPSAEARAFRYMTRFRCIGVDCEDNCCHSWDVPVDRGDHDKLQRAMAGNEESRRLFQIGLKRNPTEAQTPNDYARLEHKPDGSCSFLSQDGACQIHGGFGESALPMICSSYPRSSWKVLGQPELSGFMSCPEVARLSLLASDAMELVPFDPGSLPRPPVVEASAADPYVSHMSDIRSIMMGFLRLTQYPVATRLFVVSYLADKLAPFFHRDSKSFSDQRLADEIGRVADPNFLAMLHGQFGELEASSALTVDLVQNVLRGAASQSPHRAFRDLISAMVRSYEGAGMTSGPMEGAEHASAEPEVDADAVWRTFQARRASVEGRFGARVDQFLTHYALNYWFTHWYTRSTDLLAYQGKLLVNVAALRFLLISHPQLYSEALALDDNTQATELLDRTAVRVFYPFVRAIEHDQRFAAAIQSFLDRNGIRTLAHHVFLLKS